MKAVVDATCFTGPRRTGIGNYGYHVCRALLRQGVDLEFLSFGEREGFPLDPERLEPLSAMERNFRGLIARRFFPRRGEGWFWCPFYSWPQGMERRAKVLLTVHDLLYLSEHSDRHMDRFTRAELRFKRKFTRAVERAHRFVAVSRATADHMEEVFGTPSADIAVAYPGVDRTFFTSPGPEKCLETGKKYGIDGPYSLCLSSVSPRRDIAAVIGAFAKIASSHPEARLVIAGSRSYSPEYTRHVESLAGWVGEGRVLFLDYVDSTDLPALYGGAVLFVSASRFEGFDMPVVEALSCGTPVAVSDIPVHREVSGGEASYFDAGDASALAEIMDEAFRKGQGDPLFHTPDRFTWDRSARVYRTIFAT